MITNINDNNYDNNDNNNIIIVNNADEDADDSSNPYDVALFPAALRFLASSVRADRWRGAPRTTLPAGALVLAAPRPRARPARLSARRRPALRCRSGGRGMHLFIFIFFLSSHFLLIPLFILLFFIFIITFFFLLSSLHSFIFCFPTSAISCLLSDMLFCLFPCSYSVNFFVFLSAL